MNSAAWIVIGIVVGMGVMIVLGLCMAAGREPPKPWDEEGGGEA